MTRKIAASVIVLGLLLIPQLQAAEESPEVKPVIKKAPLPKDCLQTMDGKFLYQQLCVSCHGVSGRGTGPAAAVLDQRPPDLTHMTMENEGRFPSVRVIEAISGKYHQVAGDRVMPRWERILGGEAGKEAFGRLRVYNLTQYVKSFQVAAVTDQ